MDLGSALLGFVTVVMLKGTVMTITLIFLIKLWRSMQRPKRPYPWVDIPDEDRTAMWLVFWGVALFMLAELGCASGAALIFMLSSGALDIVHSVASGAGMALFALGVYIYLDRKLLRYGTRACLVNRLCHGCTVERGNLCKFRPLIILFAVLALALSMFPLWVAVADIPVDPLRVALPIQAWNQWYDAVMVPYFTQNVPGYQPGGKAYFIPAIIMAAELRVMPVMAGFLALVTLIQVLRGKEHAGIAWLFATLGFLAYIYFEILLYPGSGDALLGSFGHEAVELWFLLCLWVFLKRAFPVGRPALHHEGPETPSGPAPGDPQ